ncbi:MAG: MMPL family transporter [Mycobacteriales bacterium]|nr:MMPL family transporter [Mycobacteriales bacterium]
MLGLLARRVVALRKVVLLLALLFVGVAGALGGGVAEELSSGGFDDPKAPSVAATTLLESEFDAGSANVFLLASVDPGTPSGVDGAKAAGLALTERLAAEPGVIQVRSYWTTGADVLKSTDGTKALVLGRFTGTEDEQIDKAAELAPRYNGEFQGLTVGLGGEMEVFRQVGDTIERDLARAEAIAFPVTAVLLVLVFGSAIAAGLPLLVGILSILGTFLTLHVLQSFTDVSVYSVNLAISLGLGLGIDYALFMVTRFREELKGGLEVPDAVVRTVRTAGRTVLFSALTVLLSLGALWVFPLYFLRSFAYAGIAAVFFAAVGALVVLPAALAALGHRVDRYDLRKPVRRLLRRPEPTPQELAEHGMWHRIAVTVMKRPLPIATGVIALLLFVGSPFLGVQFGLPDDRVLPREASGQQLAQVVRDDFPTNEQYALSLVATDVGDPSQRRADIDSYAASLSAVQGVVRVDAFTGSYAGGTRVVPGSDASTGFASDDATYLSVVPDKDSAYGPGGEQLVERLRDVGSPFDELVVGGAAASLSDTKASLADSLPLALGLIAVATFVLLFLFTGSVVVPIKAVVLNLLSLTATFGVMVWVFQEGHLTWLIGDPITTGTLDTTTPILMFCVLFGLSMDYEVFLLSRIKEEYDEHGDNTRAVAMGLEKTGRLVSAAAGLLALVFLAFVSSDIAFIKLLGLGTALAVVVDATLVRGALVPAFMRLAGRANWWAPRPLRRLHDRIGLREAPEPVQDRELVGV